MSHRSVREVMTTEVATVTEGTPFKDLAALMARRQVSALPVVAANGLVTGLVSEADLLPKEEFAEDRRARPLPWWHRIAERRRARGLTAKDVMTFPVVTIGAGASVVAAARLMDRERVKRLVVTEPGGRLAGVVSRSDLIRIFLRPDSEIRDEIRHDVFAEYLWTNPALVRVSVSSGMVTLAGEVEKKSMIPVAIRMCRSVDGVVDVVSQLSYATDDTHEPRVPDLTDY